MSLINQYRNVVPLVKVIKAAIVDSYEDIGKTYQKYSHWGARGLAKLQGETLKHGKRKVLIPVTRNTLTATLPPDCGLVLFAGIINEQGVRIPLKVKSDIVDVENVEIIEPESSKCPKCKQNKAICDDMYISQETNLIIINGEAYEESITKKLYPNGDMYLEKTTPTLNLESGLIENEESKEFIANIDLKECGCPDDTEDNIAIIRKYCPEAYASYYAPCVPDCHLDYGSIKILEEEGLIAVSQDFPFKAIYIEYAASMPKVNGQYIVPQVAFETLVEWIKFKSVQNKRSVSLNERNWYFSHYTRERKNMEKLMGRVKLSQIIQSIGLTPKFIVTGNSCDRQQVVRQVCKTKDASKSTPQVIETIIEVREGDSSIAYGKIFFEVGKPATNPLMNEGDNTVTIQDTGIIENSVNITVDSVPIDVDNDQSQLHIVSVVYATNGALVTFSDQAANGQKYRITYTKKVNA